MAKGWWGEARRGETRVVGAVRSCVWPFSLLLRTQYNCVHRDTRRDGHAVQESTREAGAAACKPATYFVLVFGFFFFELDCGVWRQWWWSSSGTSRFPAPSPINAKDGDAQSQRESDVLLPNSLFKLKQALPIVPPENFHGSKWRNKAKRRGIKLAGPTLACDHSAENIALPCLEKHHRHFRKKEEEKGTKKQHQFSEDWCVFFLVFFLGCVFFFFFCYGVQLIIAKAALDPRPVITTFLASA